MLSQILVGESLHVSPLALVSSNTLPPGVLGERLPTLRDQRYFPLRESDWYAVSLIADGAALGIRASGSPRGEAMSVLGFQLGSKGSCVDHMLLSLLRIHIAGIRVCGSASIE